MLLPLATKHMGSQLSDQGSNLDHHHLCHYPCLSQHGKAKSQPLDLQGSSQSVIKNKNICRNQPTIIILLQLKISKLGSSVFQQLRICLAVLGTPVGSLVQEDPTCWAHAPWEPMLCNKETTEVRSLPTVTKRRPRSLKLKKAQVQQRTPTTAKKQNK